MNTSVPFLSADWLRLAAAGLGEAGGPTPPVPPVRVCQIVTGTPKGEVRYLVTVEGGRVRSMEALEGKQAGSDAEVVLTATFRDAVAMAKGEQNPAVLFMQGRLKTAGDPGLTLEYLRLASFPDVLAQCRDLAGRTDFAAA